MGKAHELLKQHWGHTQFRPLQEEIIQHVLNQQDVLALMPTGGGKSICFQLPALMQPGVTLVITPLIALMQDQVRQLQERNIPAAAIYAGMSKADIVRNLTRAIDGNIKLLYLSPERLKTAVFLERLVHMDVRTLAVDEAHCISQWGYDFRPAYLAIPDVKKYLPRITTIAVTATATPQVQKDIQDKLAMHHPVLLKKSFARANLAYMVRHSANKDRALLSIIPKMSGSMIVYTSTRRETQRIASLLDEHGITADYYHAGLEADVRKKKQAAWIQEAKQVMVATNAFGMGIDKPNVRLVLHTSPPSTLEAYYQEAGRAGRDEKKAYAVLLYDEENLNYLIVNTKKHFVSTEKVKMLYQLLANYYQVAVGSHGGVTYGIDFEHFAATYGLEVEAVRAGIKQLESAKLVQVDEQTQPAQVQIVLHGKQLYAFQVANPGYQKLLKTVIDLYFPFAYGTNVSIKRIAHACKKTVKQVDEQLGLLASLGVVVYKRAGKPALFTFLTPRYATDNLPVGNTDVRKKRMLKKVQAVIHYVKHKYRCRTQLLLAYFGEVSYKKCGVCDVCLAKQKNTHNQASDTALRKLILAQLTKEAMPVHLLIEQIDLAKAEAISEVVRTMLENNELAYDDCLRLYTVQKT